MLFQNWKKEYLDIQFHHRLDDERSRFGATRADLGGYLCALWDLPGAVIGGVVNHHTPGASAGDGVAVPTVVHAARAVFDAGFDASRADLDRAHLEEVGAISRIDRWAVAAAGE